MNKPHNSVVAIIVIYFPILDDLNRLLEATLHQVDSAVLIDNTPQADRKFMLDYTSSKNLHVIPLGDNLGIAYAQNIGIKWASDQGADFVLLLDQDSVPYFDMVEKLKDCINNFTDMQINVAAAGPVVVDKRNGISSKFALSDVLPNIQYKSSKTICVDFLISSGCLIKLSSILEIGGKRSNYFIDHVDTEWCRRAKSMGAYLFGVLDAKLDHSIGDRQKKLFGRSIPYHSPLRDYYMFRNTIFTVKDSKAPIKLNFILLFRLIKYFLYFVVFAPNRMSRMTYMMLGIKHGIFNIDGRLNIDSKECESIPRAKLDP